MGNSVRWGDQAIDRHALPGQKVILFVPGFVADTYSEIEASFVELSARAPRDLRFLWLVPEISASTNSFVDAENRNRLREPVWVPKLREHGVPYVVGNIHKYNALSNLLLFWRIFREYRIDAVYTHFGVERFWATLMAKLFGKSTIWNEHWHSLGTRLVGIKRFFYRLFVDDFIAVSAFIGKLLPGRVHTVLNTIQPVDPRRHVPKAQRRKELGILGGPDTKVVLMVAAFRDWKRHPLAFDICHKVLQQLQDVRFVFLGDGPLRPWFLSQVRRHGLDDHFIAPGYVRGVDAYYEAADVCMLTSHNEPFGYCVLEAMKFGLPIVAFASGGPVEILRNGETGVLVAEGDTDGFVDRLVELLRSDTERVRLGVNAERSVRDDFSRDQWIDRLTHILRTIVNRPPVIMATTPEQS